MTVLSFHHLQKEGQRKQGQRKQGQCKQGQRKLDKATHYVKTRIGKGIRVPHAITRFFFFRAIIKAIIIIIWKLVTRQKDFLLGAASEIHSG